LHVVSAIASNRCNGQAQVLMAIRQEMVQSGNGLGAPGPFGVIGSNEEPFRCYVMEL